MAKIIDHYIVIVDELKRLTELGNPLFDPSEEKRFLPRTISVDPYRQLPINAKIDNAISSIARSVRSNKHTIRDRYSNKDWIAIFRRSMGKPLSEIDFEDDVEENAHRLKKAVNLMVDDHEKKQFESVEVVFPTTWLSGETDGFELGPARLDTRLVWLDRQFGAKQISKTTRKRLEKHWRGGKVAARKPSWDTHSEESIKNVVGDFHYVISVEITGFSNEFTQDRAARIARLLLISASIIWAKPSSTLKGLHLAYDDLPKQSSLLWKIGNKKFSESYSSVSLPSGPSIGKEKWTDISAGYEPVFRQAQQVAEYLAGSLADTSRVEVLRKIDVALRWFYEGCRAPENLLATTHFASALDTLADGSGDTGILTMIEKRVGWSPTSAIHVDGYDLRAIVRDIYGEARSRFLHGSTEKHLSDWSSLRAMAEFICRHAIISCMVDADKNPNLNDFRS